MFCFLLEGLDLTNTIFDLLLFSSILFILHHFTIVYMASVKESIQSANIPMSSAKTSTHTPEI